jgi:hypothetical protein
MPAKKPPRLPIGSTRRLDRSYVYLFDDFYEMALDVRLWQTTGSCVLWEDLHSPGNVRVSTSTGNVANAYSTAQQFSVAAHLDITWRMKLEQTASTYVEIGASSGSGYGSAISSIAWLYDSAANANWYKSASDGTQQKDVTTIAADTNWHKFRFICNTGAITFVYDDTQVATNLTAHIPSSGLMPYVYISSALLTPYISIDYVEAWGDREA